MTRTTLTFCLCLLFISTAFAQLKKGQIDPSKVPAPSHHYQQEYTFDAPSDAARWAGQKKGLNISFASTDELYLRSEVPALQTETRTWRGTGWRGERLNVQVLVWSPDTLQQVRFKANDLVSTGGQVLARNNIRLHLVRYVLSNYPYGAADARCDVAASDTAYLMPDRFETFERFDLPGRSVRPIWISFEIPAGTEPGVYNGTVAISTEKEQASLNVSMTCHVDPNAQLSISKCANKEIPVPICTSAH